MMLWSVRGNSNAVAKSGSRMAVDWARTGLPSTAPRRMGVRARRITLTDCIAMLALRADSTGTLADADRPTGRGYCPEGRYDEDEITAARTRQVAPWRASDRSADQHLAAGGQGIEAVLDLLLPGREHEPEALLEALAGQTAVPGSTSRDTVFVRGDRGKLLQPQ